MRQRVAACCVHKVRHVCADSRHRYTRFGTATRRGRVDPASSHCRVRQLRDRPSCRSASGIAAEWGGSSCRRVHYIAAMVRNTVRSTGIVTLGAYLLVGCSIVCSRPRNNTVMNLQGYYSVVLQLWRMLLLVTLCRWRAMLGSG